MEFLTMMAFEVYINGRYVLTAGIGESGVLSSNLTWVGGHDLQPDPTDLFCHVGGLDSQTGEHIHWSMPQIGFGDEVTVKIVESKDISPEHLRFMHVPASTPAGSPEALREIVGE